MSEEIYEFSSEKSQKLCEKAVNLAARLGKLKGEEERLVQEQIILTNIALLRESISNKKEIKDLPDIERAKRSISELYKGIPV